MRKKTTHNERAAFAALAAQQNSRLVRSLNYFHYRRTDRSWRHEEVITWELVHALQLVPRRALLAPLLERCANRNPGIEETVKRLRAYLVELRVEAYPALGAEFGRNCRSDIAICHEEGTRLWIEAKVTTGPSQGLRAQLLKQENALRKVAPGTESRVIALIPDAHPQINWPAIRWTDVASVLEGSVDVLRTTECVAGDMDGYIDIATELKERIRTHERRITV